MHELRDVRLIVLKAALLVCLGVLAGGLLLFPRLDWRAALLVITVWALCRAYYFAFYVIERYVDPSYRFSGVIAAVRWMVRRSDGVR